jgi:hypothetical protein
VEIVNDKLTPLSNFITIIIFNFINQFMPGFLVFIISWGKWDSGQFELHLLLFRFYASTTVSSLLLAFSYLLENKSNFVSQLSVAANSIGSEINT